MAFFARLIRSADVLIEDFPPSSRHQAVVRADWLSALNPRLVHCSITAYGTHGRLKDEPPIDDLVMARLGILATQPGFRPGPVHLVHPLPSAGAALLAAQGIAAALLAREKTGLGRTVETSLMAGAPPAARPFTASMSVPTAFGSSWDACMRGSLPRQLP
jgi:crotonobetainyl-CoA:carnitine CoA-transferase CaiB-like acyl-CoA transferase